MKFPDNMPDEVKQALSRLMGRDSDPCRSGHCSCQQVLKLEGEGLSKLKMFISDQDKVNRRGNLLSAELDALRTEREKLQAHFWEFIYDTYGLQSKGNYHLTDDGRIMKEDE